MNNLHDLEKLVTQVRRDILRMVHKVNSGHPGGSLGCAEYFVALYNEIMTQDTSFDGLSGSFSQTAFQQKSHHIHLVGKLDRIHGQFARALAKPTVLALRFATEFSSLRIMSLRISSKRAGLNREALIASSSRCNHSGCLSVYPPRRSEMP